MASEVHLTAAHVARLRVYLARADKAADICTRLADDPAVPLAEYRAAGHAHHSVLAALAGYLETALGAAEEADQ
jgi:hypothetical protein